MIDRKKLVDDLPKMRSYAFAFTRNKHDAEDLVNDTVVRVLQGEQFFVAGTNQSAWWFTIMRNTFVSQKRKGRYRSTHLSLDLGDVNEAGKSWELPDPRASNAENLVYLQELLRQVFLLNDPVSIDTFMQSLQISRGYDSFYREIANEEGLPEGTIKSRVHRVRKKLREKELA